MSSKQQQREAEIKYGIEGNASWHQDFNHSAYVFIANLNYDMNEGDISVVFSQFGEPIDVHLVRNKKTGKSRGFCFLAYEDQRSTVLAVDNMGGAEVCGRVLRVDHVQEYKPPREYLQIKEDDPDFFDKLYKPSGPDGLGWGEFREITEEEKKLRERKEALEKIKESRNEKILENMEELQKQQFVIDADERWEKLLMDEMDNENEQLMDKIKQLKESNEKMIKKKETDAPKKKYEQKTNEEMQKHIRKEKKSKIHKQKKKE